MNLHGIVAPLINVVNPFIPATLRQSTGYTTNPDGTQVPSYVDRQMMIQVQELSSNELRAIEQVDGMNIQAVKHAVYLSGNWNGAVRVGRQGGDLVIFDKKIWLAAVVFEIWPDWTRLGVVLQNGS